jgi:transcriptional regulator of acetoin/glycerol metabolism
MEYAFVFVKGPVITLSHLPELGAAQIPDTNRRAAEPAASGWEDERITIQRALDKAEGRRSAAAHQLGISRSTLWRKMKTHGLV